MRCNTMFSISRRVCGVQLPLIVCSLLIFAIVGSFSFSGAQAGYVGSDLVWITMSDDQGRSGRAGIPNPFENLPPQANVPGHVREMITEKFAIQDGDEVLGYVDWLEAELVADPVASINFNLTAGSSDVTVTVSSATVAFSPLNNPAASAEAEVKLTDNGSSPATIETTGGNSGLFQAIFNGSSEYAELLGDSSVGGGDITFDEDTSGPIAGSVSSIQAQFAFELSAGDSASGSGVFTVVPEPTTAGLALCGCLLVTGSLRRRRRG